MEKEFEMSIEGELRHFLVLQVQQRKDGIFIAQSKYAMNLVKTFSLDSFRRIKAPMCTNAKLTKDDGDVIIDPSLYRTTTGSLINLIAS